MSSLLISLVLFKKKLMINFVAITWRAPGGSRSSSHLLPDNMAQNEKSCDRHRATCISVSRLALVRRGLQLFAATKDQVFLVAVAAPTWKSQKGLPWEKQRRQMAVQKACGDRFPAQAAPVFCRGGSRVLAAALCLQASWPTGSW